MFDLRIEEELEPAVYAAVRNGLSAFNRPVIGEREVRPLNVIVRRPDGSIAGGLIGETRWGWLYVDILWMADDTRGHRVGTEAMQLAEAEAKRRGCVGTFLDTLDFQARGFYEKLGFTVYGTQPDYPPGHERYYLLKRYDRP